MKTLRRMLTGMVLTIMVMLAVGALRADLAQEPEVRREFRDLLLRSRRGMSHDEHAAFVVRRVDGTAGFVEWPAGGEPDSARWEGAYPARTIAIAHTHPNWLPQPSRLDSAVARRAQLPVYVITRGRLSKTDGAAIVIVEEGEWAERESSRQQGSPIDRAQRAAGAELARRHAETEAKLLPEVVLGIEAAATGDLRDAEIASLQQLRGLFQPFLLEEVAEQAAGHTVKASGDVLARVTELAGHRFDADLFIASETTPDAFDQ
jgi:proteasome lid subunit RPN8/RPN11